MSPFPVLFRSLFRSRRDGVPGYDRLPELDQRPVVIVAVRRVRWAPGGAVWARGTSRRALMYERSDLQCVLFLCPLAWRRFLSPSAGCPRSATGQVTPRKWARQSTSEWRRVKGSGVFVWEYLLAMTGSRRHHVFMNQQRLPVPTKTPDPLSPSLTTTPPTPPGRTPRSRALPCGGRKRGHH